ncbi:transposase [Methanocaldococcus vulcanius]|nr:transposase [Methanocaldococcus vulcanius]
MINKTRVYGEHLTSTEIFKEFILPEIKDKLYNFIWVDLFAGKGNLILPILELIPQEERIDFFKEHIFLFDIQEKMIYEAIKNAEKYGIPKNIAKNNIIKRDTLKKLSKIFIGIKPPSSILPEISKTSFNRKNKRTAGRINHRKMQRTYTEVLDMVIAPDHVHLLLDADPTIGINKIVVQIKRIHFK